MTYTNAIILGIVQGLAEFLPISSSGHLALLQHFFHVEADKVLMFTVLLHIGTLLSVFIMYWRDIWELIKEFFITIADLVRGRGLRLQERPVRKLGVMIIVATIPTALMGFLLNALDHSIDDVNLYGGNRLRQLGAKLLMAYAVHVEKAIARAVRSASRLAPPPPYDVTRRELGGVLGVGCKMGEGWLLTAEMCELIDSGVPNIVCVQPFGCLPNHIAGKGTIRALREKHPEANIVPIDYDPGATRVNQENRLKLMLSVAREQRAGATP